MGKKRKRTQRPPEVLDLAFDGQVRSLDATILSLLPDPPPSSPELCRCRGRLCLACLGRYHLFQPNDPPEYAQLLRRTYCFVPPDAPPPPLVFLPAVLDQRKIVRNTIELLLDNSRSKINRLCVGYDKQTRFSSVGEVLCTHAWDLLLERIGDQLMVYLLRNSSIFLPLIKRSYRQVTGPPLSELPKVSHKSARGMKQHQVDCKEKLKRPLYTPATVSHDENVPVESSEAVGEQMALTCSFQTAPRKRRRIFSWQRSKKRKKLLELERPHTSVVRTDKSDLAEQRPSGVPKFSPFQDVGAMKNVEPQSEAHMCNWKIRSHSEKMEYQCVYYLLLQISRKTAMEDQISRKSVFYNTVPSYYAFPRRHILNRVKPDNFGAALLMKRIFGFSREDFQSCIPHFGVCAKISGCLYNYLLCVLKSLIRNAQHCRYRKLLLKHCPFPNFESHSKDDNETTSETVKERSLLLNFKKRWMEFQKSAYDAQLDLVNCHARHKQVVSFVWAVTRSIVPLALLGNYSSWRGLRSNISKFVGLRRYENFSLGQCVHGFESSQYSFLPKVNFSSCFCYNVANEIGSYETVKEEINKSTKVKMALRVQIFQCWIYWYFSRFVAPLIRSCFYVTERQSERHNVFYYPLPIWKKLANNNIINCLKEQNFKLLDHASLTSILNKRGFGFSRSRFLPKKKGVRILANGKMPSKLLLHGNHSREKRFVFYRSLNSSVKELHAILRRIQYEHPEVLGSSVFNYYDVYQKLCQFLQQVKAGTLVMGEVYIVVGDVARAFDSIDQDKLLEIMKGIIQKDVNLLGSYTKVISTGKGIKAFYNPISYDPNSSHNYIRKLEVGSCLHSFGSVTLVQGGSKCVKKEDLHLLLTELLMHNVLQINRNFYLQRVGISQGNTLSCLLCSFYFGHLERREIFPYLEQAHEKPKAHILNKQVAVASSHYRTCSFDSGFRSITSTEDDVACFTARDCNNDAGHENSSSPKYLLLRLIDDFLFISTSKQQATKFFLRMRRGFNDYNFSMNKEKFGLSFDVEENNRSSNCLYIGTDGIKFIPWSGLLVNCSTLEIQADYTRYLGTCMNSAITVHINDNVGSNLATKLCDYVRPKCHPIFYDSNINSASIVRLNAYQAFLLSAMKFHCYICSISRHGKLNPEYLMTIIEQSFRYMYTLIKKQIRTVKISLNIHPMLKLKKVEVIWLGLSAYIWVLAKKQARHKELVSLLRYKFATYGRMDEASASLKYATDHSHSSVFWDIDLP